MIWIVGMYILALTLTLIGTSLVGGVYAVNRLDPSQQTYRWVSIGLGTLFLYPSAVLLYHCGTSCYHIWSERPGVIIHGTRNAFSRTRKALSKQCQCGALNSLQTVFGDPLQSFFSQDQHQQQLNEHCLPNLELMPPFKRPLRCPPSTPMLDVDLAISMCTCKDRHRLFRPLVRSRPITLVRSGLNSRY
jgi:hypothetical protein